jgi:predicted CoA-binding protein
LEHRLPRSDEAHAVVWFQLGIRNDAVAERLARAGIRVVLNRW